MKDIGSPSYTNGSANTTSYLSPSIMDYATVRNIQLFTGNGLVIRCANEQGKLISRGQ